MSDLKFIAQALGILAVLALLFWIGIADAVLEWRNPKANKTTFYTHFSDVMHFRKVPDFQ